LKIMPYTIVVGSYSSQIAVLEFDPSTSPPRLSGPVAFPSGKNPSWISAHPSDRSLLFAVNEDDEGKLQLFKYDHANSKLDLVGETSSGGAAPAHLLVLEDEVIVANYNGGSILSIPITLDPPQLGTPSEPIKFDGSGPHASRQTSSHPHQVILHPKRQELLIPDLGVDKVWRLSKEDGKWQIKGFVQMPSGSGPRHAVLYDDVLYIVGELTNTLSAYKLPPFPSEPEHIVTIPTVLAPREADPSMTAAAAILAPPNASFPGPFLYVTNRDDPHPDGDSIAIYSLPASSTSFELVREVHTGFKHARGLSIGGPDNKYLIAGGERGGGITIFERTHGGKSLKEVAHLKGVERPTGFAWI